MQQYNFYKSAELGSLVLKNRFIKAATFEGMYDDGIPNKKLVDFHSSMAKGGVGLTTISYASVSANGRTFKDQMYVNPESLVGLRRVVEAVHEVGGKISIQLTHCGYFSKNTRNGVPIAPSRVLNEYGMLSGLPFSKAMNESDLEETKKDFVWSAQQLKRIGFDTLELHLGHGYLLSQFLSPKTNKRKDQYGGSLENRARYPLEVFRAIKDAVGTNFPVLVKLNLEDGFKKGFSVEDCIEVCKKLESANCDGVVLSGGFTSKSPFFLLRGDVPLKGMVKNGSNWAEKLTMALFGPAIIKKYNYSSNFFLELAKRVRQQVKLPLVYLGGVDSRQGIEEIQKAGFDFVAIGRALIHDPNFLQKIENGEISKSGCTHCNQCIVEMDRGGVRCTL
ncbi:MAG: NADH:flavin oxidoreductase [Schleiferiaceae bacterium]|jgi:2,4-dienoyl-CoA reductase-like NADH-dependent reductase (Old Yellow Enzyme family)|nr:NADH:flavin oxidoreductase [Schleiferiaceae bacterium]